MVLQFAYTCNSQVLANLQRLSDSDRDAAKHVGTFKDHGYTVLEGLLADDTLARFRTELQPFLNEGQLGRNDFEGYSSKRAYSPLSKTSTVAALVEHPDVLAMIEESLLPNYLLTWCLATGRHALDNSDRIRSILGYSFTPPFMGYVDGRYPMKCLDDDFDPDSTGDGARSRVFWDGEYRFRAADATEGA